MIDPIGLAIFGAYAFLGTGCAAYIREIGRLWSNNGRRNGGSSQNDTPRLNQRQETPFLDAWEYYQRAHPEDFALRQPVNIQQPYMDELRRLPRLTEPRFERVVEDFYQQPRYDPEPAVDLGRLGQLADRIEIRVQRPVEPVQPRRRVHRAAQPHQRVQQPPLRQNGMRIVHGPPPNADDYQ